MATICAKKELPSGCIVLRPDDEEECRAAGVSGDRALRYSVSASDYFDAVYVDDVLGGVWGYAAESLFSYRARAWLLTTEVCDKNKVAFTRISIKIIGFLLEKFEEVEVCVWHEHHVARKWLLWLGFEKVAESPSGFLFMVVKRGTARWVS